MIRAFVATIFLGWLVFPALAASLDTAAVNNAEYSSKLSTDSIEAAAIRVQVLLARAQFSPGEIDKAQAMFDRVVGVANDLGLLAEEYDSGEGRQAGNFPQALTHIALINTAHNLSDAKKSNEKPAMQRSK